MKFKNLFKSDIEAFITAEQENLLYTKASEDIANNIINTGLWTKAYSQAGGDESKQKAIYIDLLVDYYKKLFKAGEEFEDIIASEEQRKKRQEAKAARAKYESEKPIREQAEYEREQAEYDKTHQASKEAFIKENSKEEYIRKNKKNNKG